MNLSFTGLVNGTWYLGQTVYNDGTSDIGTHDRQCEVEIARDFHSQRAAWAV